jgi:Ca2+-binding RTX toxin-like protein
MADFTLTEQADYWNSAIGGYGIQTTAVIALGGNDYIIFNSMKGAVTVYAGEGDDVLLGGSAPGGYVGNVINRIYGENGNDLIMGGYFNFQAPLYGTVNYLDGGAGNDTIISGSFNDTVRAGDGNDWIQAYYDCIIWGDGGSDTIIGDRTDTGPYLPINARGNEGDDYIYGSLNKSDTLSGDEGFDVLVGYGGDDYLYLGAGGGTAYGDLGFFYNSSEYDYVGNDVGVGAEDADNFIMGGGNDAAYGYGGRDYLLGEGGNDTLIAGDGNDVIYGGAGMNFMYGDGGDDVFISEGSTDQMEGGTGHNYYYRYGAGTSYSTGGAGIDEFIGDAFASNDTVVGGAGNDYLYGGGGNDLLQGGADNDVILGQAGNDTLEGGSGVNLLWANDAGNDQILVNVADGGTQVVDFFEAGGTNDVLRLLGSSLTSFAGIEALRAGIGSVIGGNLLVNAGSGAQLYLNVGTATQTAIWFQGVSAYSLTSADFLFS